MNEATTPLQKAEVAAALSGGAFASPLERGAPLAIVSGEPLRLVHATPAAVELFGVRSPEGLEAMLIGSQSPGARRLRRLAAAPVMLSRPRLEQLRFYVDGAPMSISLTTGHVSRPHGEPWLVVAANPLSQNVEPKSLDSNLPPTLSAEPGPSKSPVRFLWASDAQGHFTLAGPELAERLGANSPTIGESVADLAARTGLGGQWPEALQTQQTFSGLRLEWPQPMGGRAWVVKLSAAPAVDPAKAFVGFRGFGVLTGETVPTTWKGVQPAPARPARSESQTADSPVQEEVGPTPRPGAEIFLFRPGAPTPEASTNIVPIRPGALNVLGQGQDGPGSLNPDASVELTNQERDAFREIARALGARRPESEFATIAETPEAPLEGALEHRAEEELPSAALADLTSLIDALPVGALILRGDQVRFANRALLDFAGYDSLDALAEADGLNTMFRGRSPRKLLAEGVDAPVVAAGGELVIVHGQTSELQWEGGPATLVSLRRSPDVEHRETAAGLEAEARSSEQRARDNLAALDVATDGFMKLDANGRILMMSPRAEVLFGYIQQEAAGTNFLTLLSPQSQGPALSAFLRAMGPKAGLDGKSDADGQARGSNGRLFSCRMRFTRAAGADPAEAFMLVENREGAGAVEHELEAARQEAVRANERKTEFLALVSHEIRTPLQAILGFAEVMVEERFGPVGNERYKDYLKDIHASGMHVISLANDLIDLVKIEAGKMELVFEPVDANRIIRDCVALMQPQAARERIIMRLSLSDKLPNVMADERSLRQIMLNLMSNAVKFNEPGGQVIVSTAMDDAGAAVIRVRDTGVGMNEGELALALEPFRRAESGKTADGSGLGLPLTKALVEANHADFSIKSRKEQGTLVEVAFSSIRAAQ